MLPTNNYNIHEFQFILLSDKFEWNPSNNLFEMSSLEEDYITSSNIHRHVNLFTINITCVPLTIQCR